MSLVLFRTERWTSLVSLLVEFVQVVHRLSCSSEVFLVQSHGNCSSMSHMFLRYFHSSPSANIQQLFFSLTLQVWVIDCLILSSSCSINIWVDSGSWADWLFVMASDFVLSIFCHFSNNVCGCSAETISFAAVFLRRYLELVIGWIF